MRKYTVEELNALRNVYTKRWLYGTSLPEDGEGWGWSRTYTEQEKVKCVEELVRTAMLAGITAEEVYEADRKKNNQDETSNSPSS